MDSPNSDMRVLLIPGGAASPWEQINEGPAIGGDLPMSGNPRAEEGGASYPNMEPSSGDRGSGGDQPGSQIPADQARNPSSGDRGPAAVLPYSSQSPETVIGLGCYWAILDEAHITLLAVTPPYRGQGLGRWLLLHLLQGARDRGMERATLEVRASNAPALALYRCLGFKTAGRRRGYYDDGEDALILWCNGLQTPHWADAWDQWQDQSDRQLRAQGWRLPVRAAPALVSGIAAAE